MILAVVLSALVLFGWSAVSERYLPSPKPAVTRTVDTSPVAPANTPAPSPAAVVQDRAKVIAATSRIAIRTPKVVGSINQIGRASCRERVCLAV